MHPNPNIIVGDYTYYDDPIDVHNFEKNVLCQRVFFNPRTNTPWETDGQIRKTCWTHILRKAGVRYRNPYQTRHTYASMMLSAGENALWVAKQMGHRDTEMIIKNYGRWIPDKSTMACYKTVNEWVSPLMGVATK